MLNNWNKFTCYKSTGAKGLSGTFNNAAVVDAGAYGLLPLHTVTLPDNAHGLLANSDIYVSGSVNYDGMRHISAVATNTMNVNTRGYTAETLAGTELWCVGVGNQNKRVIFHGFTIHLSAAPTTAENLTITLDAADGSAWDVLEYTLGMAGETDKIWFPDVPLILESNDVLRFAWTNTDLSTWGIRIYVEDIG